MKKLSKKKKTVIIIASCLVALLVAGFGISYAIAMKQLGKINYEDAPKDPKIDTTIYTDKNKDVMDQYINILLIGADIDKNATSRSDSMMILTIDKKHNTIKISSLMRDMLVNQTGHGPMQGKDEDRLNHAYAYGGPSLLIQTINQNFKTNIKDFISCDYAAMERIVNEVGGVEINVKDSEIKLINKYQKNIAKVEKDNNVTLVTHGGKQVLNGRQAVAYCRIRYVGNADFERTQRQRTVLNVVFKKLMSQNILKINSDIGDVLPYVKTSLTKSTIMSLAATIVTNKMNTMEQLRLPIDGHFKSTTVNKVYFLVWNDGDDKNANLEALHKFIYQEDYNADVLK